MVGERVYHYRYRQDKFPLNIDKIIEGNAGSNNPKKVEKSRKIPDVRPIRNLTIPASKLVSPVIAPKPVEDKKQPKGFQLKLGNLHPN